MTEAVMREAIKLARQLAEIASIEKSRAVTARGAQVQQLHLADAKTCEDAAAMLQKLGTEVTRLREGIGCYMYGRLERHELRSMTENWNMETPHFKQRPGSM